MASITAAGSGNWNSTTANAPWPSGTVPTSADDVTIDAAHTVNVTASGAAAKTLAVNSTAGTKGLDINPAGVLTLGDPATYGICLNNGSTSSATPSISIGGQLVLKGAVTQGDCPIELYGNGDVYADRTAAHAGTYGWAIGTANLQANAYIMTRRTGAGAVTKTSRVTIRSSPTGSCANLRFLYAPVGGGTPVGNMMSNMLGVDFTRIGDATSPMFNWLPGGASTGFQLSEFRCVSCGNLFGNVDVSGSAHVDVTNGTVTSSVASVLWIDFRPSSGLTTGSRNFTGLRLDQTIRFGGPNITLSNVVFNLPTGIGGCVGSLTGTTFDVFEDIVWFQDNSAIMDWPNPSSSGAALRFQRVYGMSGGGNSRWFGMGSVVPTVSTDFTAHRIHAQDINNGSTTGDQFCYSGSNPAPGCILRYNVRNCIMLPYALDKTKQTAKIVSPLGNISNTRWSIEHCTWITTTDGETGVQCGETQTANIGQIFDSIRDNIAFCPTGSGPGAVVVRTGAVPGVQSDLMSPATCDYNGKHNVVTGTDGAGYDAPGSSPPKLSTGTLGVHDVVGDPGFFDPRLRDFALWASDIWGNQGSVALNIAKGIAELFAANDPSGFDARAIISGTPGALIDWVEQGYAPTNAAFHGTAHDGTDLGAVPFVAAATKLGIVRQPIGGVSGSSLPTQPAGQVQDSTGTIVGTDTSIVTAILTVTAGSGSITSGGTTLSAGGAWDFNDAPLTVGGGAAGTGFLTFTDGTLTPAVSTPFSWTATPVAIEEVRINGSPIVTQATLPTLVRESQNSGTQAGVVSATPTTLFVLPATVPGMYIVSAWVTGSLSTGSADVRIICDGASLFVRDADNGSAMSLALAGTNLQATLTGLGTKDVHWVYSFNPL